MFFEQLTGGKMVHVPYKSRAESLTVPISGQGTDIIFENLAPALPHIKAGKLRALGVTSEKSGARRAGHRRNLAEIRHRLVAGAFAPAGVPKPVVERLSIELIKSIQDPDTKAKLVAQGIEPGGMTPAELAAFQKSDVEKWARLIKAGISGSSEAGRPVGSPSGSLLAFSEA